MRYWSNYLRPKACNGENFKFILKSEKPRCLQAVSGKQGKSTFLSMQGLSSPGTDVFREPAENNSRQQVRPG